MTKMSTTYTLVIRITGLQAITIFLANLMAMFSIFAICNRTELEAHGGGREPPFLYTLAEDLFQAVSTLQFRRRFNDVARSSPWL